jgi:pimeloyl-ACP methyl ester carboxylesterase
VPQFRMEVGGQPIHFMHVRSPEPDALPLVLTHGWPSSPVEFQRVIGPLTDPRAYGGDPADAFHVVLPSLPGYGFSTPVRGPGWGNLFTVAQTWATLMTQLGYERYAVQGTDVGAGVAEIMPYVAGPGRIAGVHVNGPSPAQPLGPPLDLAGLSGRDLERARRFNEAQADGLGYLHLQATRPQTLGYGLTDSPVAQLAWIVEKFHEWTDPAAVLPEDAVDRDHLLTAVSVYWFTGSGASAAHGTYEGMRAWRQMAAQGAAQPGNHGGPPRGVAVFAADTTVRSILDPDGAIGHWSEFDRGGHFPAMEVPDLLVGDIRAFFAGLR